jgi:hypothetical protein
VCAGWRLHFGIMWEGSGWIRMKDEVTEYIYKGMESAKHKYRVFYRLGVELT